MNNLHRCFVAWRTWGEKPALGTCSWVPCSVPAGWGEGRSAGPCGTLHPLWSWPFLFYRIPRPLGKRHSEGQTINTLPLGFYWRYWLFLRQHNNLSTSLLPPCVFKRITLFLYLSQEKLYLFYCDSITTLTGKIPTFCCTTELNGGRCYLGIELLLQKKDLNITKKLV